MTDACKQPGIRAQFRCPHGWLGWLVGHLMALKNRERSEWVLSLLNVHPEDHVLEIGFGSGVDIRRVAQRARQGYVAGIDHSAEMLRQATARNREAILEGRVDLRLGSAVRLPYGDASFDKVYAINVAQFFDDRASVFREYRRVLRPGGRLVIAVQPRSKAATEASATQVGENLHAAATAAGFADVRIERRPMRPVSTVCVLGSKPHLVD
ncbi:MAG: methyltransferase domain-containing protein [Bryobacterales bacterium]|nr:methyltransferase domain-containing protein [Bryobacterales bacterium]